MMDMKEVPIIWFNCKENFCSRRIRAYKINKWLAVAPSDNGYKIFRMDTGLPLIDTVFINKEPCLEFALWIAEKYKDVFDVWEAERDWELLRIAQYTIPNGTEVYKVIEKVSSQRVICQS